MEYSVSNTVLQSASVPDIAYDVYFISKRYVMLVSEKGITTLDPIE